MAQTLVKTIANFQTQLSTGSAIGATSIVVASVTDGDGVALPSGTYGFTIDEGTTTEEHFTAVLTTTNTTLASVSHVTRGTSTGTSGLNLAHRRGATVKITDHPAIKRMMNNLDGTTGFNSLVKLGYDADPGLTSGDTTKFATVEFVNGIAVAGAPDASTSTKGITKMSVAPASATAPIAVGTNDYRVNPNNYAADAGGTDAYAITLTNAPASYVTGQVFYFKANTANTGTATLNVNALGAITIVRSDGTTLLTGDILANQLVQVQYNGTSFIMQSAPASTVNLAAGVYPAGDASLLTGVVLKKESYTASGAIAQNDSVYVSAANTVKTIYPSAMGTPASVTTNTSHTASVVQMPLSTVGTYLHITGGSKDNSAVLYGQVRTLNAAETDFANGSETNIYNTGNGTRNYDVCPIGTDKFLIIFQADTGGSPAGIKCIVITVSGTTVTAGSATTIETAGTFGKVYLSCAKADTDKAVIYYMDDAGSDLFGMVLTVSGTTITTNTRALVKAGSNFQVKAIQMDTNSNMIVFSQAGTTTIKALMVSISGTTPTYGSENTVYTDANSDNYYFGMAKITTTKALITYAQTGNNLYDTALILTNASGTITAGSSLTLSAARATWVYGISVIGTKYALVAVCSSSTVIKLLFLDVSGTTPTEISNTTVSNTSSTVFDSTAVVKVAPWTYYFRCGESGDGDYIVKLTPSSSARLGLAESAISDTASGNILYRYLTQTLSGITLTPGSFYYVDDTGQPTTGSSLTSPTIGFAISTTKMLLQ